MCSNEITISQRRRSEHPLSKNETKDSTELLRLGTGSRLSCRVPLSPKGSLLRFLMRLYSELRGVSAIEQGTGQRSQWKIKCALARAASSFIPGNISRGKASCQSLAIFAPSVRFPSVSRVVGLAITYRILQCAHSMAVGKREVCSPTCFKKSCVHERPPQS